jgi:hypothetical protein
MIELVDPNDAPGAPENHYRIILSPSGLGFLRATAISARNNAPAPTAKMNLFCQRTHLGGSMRVAEMSFALPSAFPRRRHQVTSRS